MQLQCMKSVWYLCIPLKAPNLITLACTINSKGWVSRSGGRRLTVDSRWRPKWSSLALLRGRRGGVWVAVAGGLTAQGWPAIGCAGQQPTRNHEGRCRRSRWKSARENDSATCMWLPPPTHPLKETARHVQIWPSYHGIFLYTHQKIILIILAYWNFN